VANGLECHHIYYPRRDYKTKTQKKFRELRCNKIYLDHETHVQIHRQRRASEMPTREQMLQRLDICKDCKGDCSARLAELEVQMSEM